MFDDEFVESLPEEVLPAAQKIKAKFDASDEAISQKEHAVEAYYNAYLKAYGLLQAFASAKELGIDFPELTDIKMDSIMIIRQAFFDLGREITKLEKNKARNLLESTKFHFSTKFGGVFSYEFSQGDLKKIESLINGIGKFVSGSSEFDQGHKSRLLKRLKELQDALDKKVPSLDPFWGLVGEAGIAKAKLDRVAKPVVERVRKIIDIVWQTQARAEELPSGLDFATIWTSDD
jgi:hypothetical protein